jgi:hypothetical protein
MTDAERANLEDIARRYGTTIYAWRSEETGEYVFSVQVPMERSCIEIVPPLTIEQQLRKDLDERARRIGMAKAHLADAVRHFEMSWHSHGTPHRYWAMNAIDRAVRALTEGVERP